MYITTLLKSACIVSLETIPPVFPYRSLVNRMQAI